MQKRENEYENEEKTGKSENFSECRTLQRCGFHPQEPHVNFVFQKKEASTVSSSQPPLFFLVLLFRTASFSLLHPVVAAMKHRTAPQEGEEETERCSFRGREDDETLIDACMALCLDDENECE